MRKWRAYIDDIITAMASIENFIAGMDFEEFVADDKTSSAVLRKLEIIGEAAKNIPDPVKQKSPHLPWREMAGMRDRLIHAYFGVDYELVWRTIRKRLPEVRAGLEKLLDKE